MNFENKEDESAYYRGLLIQKTIDLELRMEIIIARFLSLNNQDRVLDLIEIFDIAMIDFSQKVKILNFIVKKHIKDFLKVNDALTENRNKFFSDLNFVMEKRNELAHRRHDLKTNNYLKLTWIKTEDGKLKKVERNLTEEFRNEFEEKCANSYVRLIELEIKVSELK
jgi:hypothetical protein